MVTDDVAHGGGGDVGVLLTGRDEDGLDVGGDVAVGVRNGLFRVEVHEVAYAPDDVADAQAPADFDGQAVVFEHLHAIAERSGCLADDVQPLFIVEKSLFVLVEADGDHDGVEHRQGPFQDVEVAGGKRVERAGEEGCSVHMVQSMGCLPIEVSSWLVLEKCRQPKNAPPASGDGWAASST